LELKESEIAANERMKVAMRPNALDERLKGFRVRGELVPEQIAGAEVAD